MAKKKVANLPAGRQGKTPLPIAIGIIAPRSKEALQRILLKLGILLSAIAAVINKAYNNLQ